MLRCALPHSAPSSPGLALGGDLKSAPCAVLGPEAFLVESLGDLENPNTMRRFLELTSNFERYFGFVPEWIACDAHPGYHSTRWAFRSGLPVITIQHHHAHVEACKAEHGISGAALGLAVDGTGLGDDGSVWGCELLLCDGTTFERLGHLLPFPTTPGDAAAIEIWHSAASALHTAGGTAWTNDPLFGGVGSHESLTIFASRLASQRSLIPCSSLGRLFDAVAFILGICRLNTFEAEAAIALELAATRAKNCQTLPNSLQRENGRILFDWRPLVTSLAAESRKGGTSKEELALAFHLAIVEMLAEAVSVACEEHGLKAVMLSGGCFLNKILSGRLRESLARRGIATYTHSRIPTGDGGIALGQAVVAVNRLESGKSL